MKCMLFILIEVLLCMSVFSACDDFSSLVDGDSLNTDIDVSEVESSPVLSVSEKVVSVNVNSMPHDYEYKLESEAADEFYKYLSDLELTLASEQPLNDMVGMTWEISIELETGICTNYICSITSSKKRAACGMK